MRLNLGCGTDYLDGWVNVDRGNCRHDVQHDIESFPWPFDDSSADYILMKHILEHISPDNFSKVMSELCRVGKAGAIVQIEAPHAGSNNYWTDPTHRMPLTVRTFDFFDETKPLSENGRIYGWSNLKIKVLEAREVSNPPNGPDVYFKLQIIK